MPYIETAVRSHPGIIRRNNEDNYYLNGVYMHIGEGNTDSLCDKKCYDKHQLYAVCDGMGGMNNGDAASLLVVTRLAELLHAGIRGLPRLLQESINDMCAALQSLCDDGNPAGCTLAMVYIDGSRICVANLGDSRVYFKRGKLNLTQVTEDHSQAIWLTKQGVLTTEEAETHPSRNVLYRFIGAKSQEGSTPDISDAMRLRRGDIFLLCSDGLSNLIDAYEMDAEIIKGQSNADICRSLVDLALVRGGEDNITALMIRAV